MEQLRGDLTGVMKGESVSGNKCFLVLLVWLAGLSFAAAALSVTNPDFESQPLVDGDYSSEVTDWFERSTEGAGESVWHSAAVLGDNDNVLMFSSESDGVGGYKGGYAYQRLGTVDPNTIGIRIQGTALKRQGYYWGDLTFDVFAGSFSAAADGTDLEGLTHVGSAVFNGGDLSSILKWGGFGSEPFITSGFNLGGVPAGTELWLRISLKNSGVDQIACLDDLAVTTSSTRDSWPVKSFDTGYTILHVRSGRLNGASVAVGASYEGTILAMDFDGNTLWTNALSGAMSRDHWCDDLDGDGNDEVLVALADGSIHCLNLTDGSSHWAQPFQPNDVPMNGVCTVRGDSNTKYVVCGGFDKNIYYLNATGVLVKTVKSSDYTQLRPWGDQRWYLGRWIGEAATVNHLRPMPQADVTDHLIMVAFLRYNDPGWLYEFEPLGSAPVYEGNVGGDSSEAVGSLNIADPDNDGICSLFIGQNSLYNIDVVERQLAGDSTVPHRESCLDENTYRFSYVTHIPDGSSYRTFILCGDQITLLGPGFDESNRERFQLPNAFNDLWHDQNSDRILLASCQSGGSAIHILDTSDAHWKSDLQGLNPPGKIEKLKTNFAAVKHNLASFSRPEWEREPDQLMNGGGGGAVGDQLYAKYANPLFLAGDWAVNVETQSWKETLPQDEPFLYPAVPDTTKNYILTREECLDGFFQPLIDQGAPGIHAWGGHGNSPYYYDPTTLTEVVDRNYAANSNNITFFMWPEIQTINPDFSYPIDRLFRPLAQKADKNAMFSFYNKHHFWSSKVHMSMWEDFISGEIKNMVPCMEESHSMLAKLSLSGRIGLWASDCVGRWGLHTTRDETCFDRSRSRSAVMIPNHFLRQSIYSIAYGARYMSNTGYAGENHQDYNEVLWELVAKGALYMPRREEIISFNPVHLSVTDPDDRYIANVTSWTTYWDADDQASNPMVVGRRESCWMGAPNTEWDFSRYAAGVEDRRMNFVPPYPNGMVLSTPVENGPLAAPAGYRNRLVNNLHPMYKGIMQEYITDGRNYISSDGTTTYSADTYYQTVKTAIERAAQKMRLTVSGDQVAWVAAQTDPTHLRLTLLDGGFVNPDDRTAEICFHTVTPVKMTDVLSGETFDVSNPDLVSVDIPCGSFRFVDVELSEPFNPVYNDSNLAITNGDFENDLVGTNSSDRVHAVSDWYESTVDGDWNEVLRNNQPATGSNHLVFYSADGYIYQSLGKTVDGEQSLQVSGTAIRIDGRTWTNLVIEVLAGAFPGAADGTDVAGQGLVSLGSYIVDGDGTVLTENYTDANTWWGDTETMNFTTEPFDLSGLVVETEIWLRISPVGTRTLMAPALDDLTLTASGGPDGLWNSFITQYALSGDKFADSDSDGVIDWAEYMTGGNPTNAADNGVLQVFDVASGQYSFSLVGDSTLTAHVLTNANLVSGEWGTNATLKINTTDGVLSNYTERVETSENQLFIRLLVE